VSGDRMISTEKKVKKRFSLPKIYFYL